MFAVKKTELVIRVLLIAAISLNAGIPTPSFASSLAQERAKEDSQPEHSFNHQPLSSTITNFDQLPIAFIPNVGQEDEDGVRFQAQALGGELFFAQEEVVFSLFNPVEVALESPEKGKKVRYDLRPASVLRIHFVDANLQPEITGLEALPGVVNYLRGDDPAGWFTNVPTHSGIAYQELYPGIELRYEGTDGILKSSFHIAPGADPSTILWKYKGADSLAIDVSGNLVITMPPPAQGEPGIVIVEYAPIA